MEAALALLRDSRQSVEGRLVRNTLRGGNVNVRQLLNEMESNLKLVGRIGDMWYLSSEGRNAADMGMKAYLQEQERKAKEPVPTKEVDDRPWWMLTKEGWISLATLIATIVFGISNCCG